MLTEQEYLQIRIEEQREGRRVEANLTDEVLLEETDETRAWDKKYSAVRVALANAGFRLAPTRITAETPVTISGLNATNSLYICTPLQYQWDNWTPEQFVAYCTKLHQYLSANPERQLWSTIFPESAGDSPFE